MLVLRHMSAEEYPAFCQYFIDDYSHEIAKNYGRNLEEAVEMAEKDLVRCFPDGLESQGHSLLCIDADIGGEPTRVGYLWHSVNEEEHSTFIYDFYIENEYRGLGLGTQTISVLESQLQAQGINQIKLRVAYHNERALKLYQEVGFIITGFNMSKNIEKR